MPLKGKYIKYSPEITLEIFTLIYSKLINSGWKEYSSKKIEESYSQFKTQYNHLTHQQNKTFNTHIYPYEKEYAETTVQEILGYDPFAKEVIKEVIPEYVECIKPQFWVNTIKENNGNLIFDTKNFKFSYYSGTWGKAARNSGDSHFKPSTKEAYYAQNQPKSIEKWSVGTYVLFLKNLGDFRAGHIDIINNKFDGSCTFLEKYLSMDISREKDGEVKWFATKSEAEKFAKTLVEPVKCGNGILDRIEPKQPLKQAVHCKTQEEWNFVTEKLNYKWNNETGTNNTWSNYGNKTFINLSEKHFNSIESKNYNFQILSFQEWCDLNGYKMEKEVKFEVGKWYKNLGVSNRSSNFGKFLSIRNGREFWMSECIYQESKVDIEEQWLNYSDQTVECSLEEIQQYLPDNHPDKITPVIQQTRDMQSKFKVGEYVICCGNIYEYSKPQICRLTSVGESITDCRGKFKFSRNNNEESESVWLKNYVRHATPEEINNHLISIGQMSIGIQSGSTSDNAYNHLISSRNKIHEEFFNPAVKFERNYGYAVNPKYKQEFNIINKTKTIKF